VCVCLCVLDNNFRTKRSLTQMVGPVRAPGGVRPHSFVDFGFGAIYKCLLLARLHIV